MLYKLFVVSDSHWSGRRSRKDEREAGLSLYWNAGSPPAGACSHLR